MLVYARREADQLIAMGLVQINGKVVTKMGIRVRRGDQVRYDDQKVNNSPPIYLLLNKPRVLLRPHKVVRLKNLCKNSSSTYSEINLPLVIWAER